MMSGIFKYNQNSPLRRSGVTPFCTSPSQLQDVTMDNSNVLGFRSPPNSTGGGGGGYGDNSSPGQGRSLREYEEQMTSLRKENFNLKLRIYFLEEKNPISITSPDGSETLFKQNVDLKVEIESLRKELQEKQDLLCQAAKALEIMEDSQKTNLEQSSEKIDELQKKIKFLEMEIETLDIDNLQQNKYIHLNDKIFSDTEAHHKFLEQETIIKNYQIKLIDLQYKYDMFDGQLKEKNQKIKELEQRVSEVSYDNFELKERIEEVDRGTLDNEGKLRSQIYEYKKEIADKTCILQDTEEQLTEKTKKYEKACVTIQQLLTKLKDKEQEYQSLKSSNGNDQDSLEDCNNMDKDKEIIYLKENLKKKTISLNNIVNKQLKDKKQILERLNELLYEKHLISNLPPPTIQLQQNNNSLNEKQLNDALDYNIKLENQLNDILIKLSNQKRDIETEKVCVELDKVDQSTTWQRSCINVCKILTTHVEELAEFLEQLLTTRNISRLMDDGKCEQMREAVDRSLDLSRNLMSLSIIDQSSIDQSLIYFNSLNDILENSHCDSFNKVLSNSVGLDETRKKIEEKCRKSNGTTSNGGGVLASSSTNNDETIDADNETEDDNDDLEAITTSKQSLRSREINKLKCLLKKKENSLRIAESTVNDVDKERHKFIEIAKKLKDLLRVRKMAHDKTIKELDAMKLKYVEKNKLISQVQAEHEKIKIDLRVNETKMETSKTDCDELKEKHRKQIESLKNQIAEMEIFKMDLEEKYEMNLKKKELEIKEKLSESWVTRVIYEKKENELLDTRNSLSETNRKLSDCEKVIDEMKQQLSTYDKNSRKLKKCLDDTTIQCSNIALERTKVLNERSIIEEQLKLLQNELNLICLERNNLANKINDLEKKQCDKNNVLTQTSFKCLPAIITDDNETDDVNNCAGAVAFVKTENVSEIKTTPPTTQSQSTTTIDTKLSNDQIIHDCQAIDKENIELKQKLVKTRRALEETWSKLKSSNQRKEQIERNIRQQVGQTHSVLKNVRNLMENGNNIEEKENQQIEKQNGHCVAVVGVGGGVVDLN